MMQFNEEQKAFEFFDLNFDTYPPKLSEINPQRCISCHHKDPRPNWDRYFFWAGAYGADDDLVYRDAIYLSRLLGDQFYQTVGPMLEQDRQLVDTFMDATIAEVALRKGREYTANLQDRYSYITPVLDMLHTQEFKAFIGLLNKRGSHPRYSYLRPVTQLEYYAKKTPYPRPNLVFTRLLEQLNSSRVARKVNDSIANNFSFRYALLASTLCIDLKFKEKQEKTREEYSASVLEKFIPPELVQQFGVTPLEYINYHSQAQRREFITRTRRHRFAIGDDSLRLGRVAQDNYLESYFLYPSSVTTQYIMELLGVDTRDWNMNRNGALSFLPGSGAALIPFDARFMRPLIQQWFPEENQINNQIRNAHWHYDTLTYWRPNRNGPCQFLQEMSLQELESWPLTPIQRNQFLQTRKKIFGI